MKERRRRGAAGALAVLAACMPLCAACAKNTAGRQIFFMQLIDNATFKEMREGFYERMNERGFGPERVAIVYKDAQGDIGTLNGLAQEADGGPYELVVTVATPAAQAFAGLQSKKPSVFIAVADPLRAGVVSDMQKPDKNATGTSNFIPVETIFELAAALTPGVRTFGFIYNLGEINSVATVQKSREYLTARGIAVKEATAANSSEVQQAAERLAAQSDALFIPNDSLVVAALPQIVEIARERGIPVYGTALVHVIRGALATAGIDDRLIGRRSADMAADILEGARPEDLPVVRFDSFSTIIGREAAAALKLDIPPQFEEALYP